MQLLSIRLSPGHSDRNFYSSNSPISFTYLLHYFQPNLRLVYFYIQIFQDLNVSPFFLSNASNTQLKQYCGCFRRRRRRKGRGGGSVFVRLAVAEQKLNSELSSYLKESTYDLSYNREVERI